MLGKLGRGDVVTVTRIDRLARSTFDLFGIVWKTAWKSDPALGVISVE
jgi:Resolvase, N terminal domain